MTHTIRIERLVLLGALLCTSLCAITKADGSPVAAAENAEAKESLPAPESPAEGTAWRNIVGERFIQSTGLKLDVEVQGGFSVNNTADHSQDGYGGGSNLPMGVPGDTGFQLDGLWVYLYRQMNTNLLPVITPLPGPMPRKFSWGFDSEILYGRDGQAGRMSGWDAHWNLNEPAASNPTLAAQTRFNFLSQPEAYVQAYVPAYKGMVVRFGRYGQSLGSEIPQNMQYGPNYFYSHTYAFLVNSRQVFGVLVDANLMRSTRYGYVALEGGLDNGNMDLESASGQPFQSFEAELQWRSPDMSTWINWNIRGGNTNIQTNAAGKTVSSTDFTLYNSIYSPRGQMMIQHQMSLMHRFHRRWSTSIEGNYMTQAGDKRADTIWMYGGPNFGGDHAIGLYGRLVYDINHKISVGGRLETFHDANGYFLAPLNLYGVTAGANAGLHVARGNFNDLTFGGNYNVAKYIRIRPEVRYDWSSDPIYGNMNSSVAAGTALPHKSQTTFNMDMLFWF